MQRSTLPFQRLRPVTFSPALGPAFLDRRSLRRHYALGTWHAWLKVPPRTGLNYMMKVAHPPGFAPVVDPVTGRLIAQVNADFTVFTLLYHEVPGYPGGHDLWDMGVAYVGGMGREVEVRAESFGENEARTIHMDKRTVLRDGRG